MRPRRSFNVYSAEKYDRTGNGVTSVRLPDEVTTDEEFRAFKERKKTEQEAENRAYRELNPTTSRRTRAAVQVDRGLELTPARQHPVGVTPASTIDLRLDDGTGNSTVLLGSSKAGKSTLLMHLYEKYYSGKDYVSILFAENAQIPLYSLRESGSNLIGVNCFEPRLIDMAHFIQKGTNNKYRFCFMLDDILDRRDDTTLKKLILSLRNSDISSIVSLQYSNLLAKNSRANVNNILLFRFNTEEAIELAISQFLKAHFRKMGARPEDMVALYKEATADHGFIYLHPATDSISFHRLDIAQ